MFILNIQYFTVLFFFSNLIGTFFNNSYVLKLDLTFSESLLVLSFLFLFFFIYMLKTWYSRLKRFIFNFFFSNTSLKVYKFCTFNEHLTNAQFMEKHAGLTA